MNKKSVKNYIVKPCSRNEIKDFIETHHYSKSINGCKFSYGFGLFDGDILIGAAFFGEMAMMGQWKRFADSEEKVIELRRLCCIDDTPKNTESYFIGKMLRWLEKNTNIELVVSYADQTFGHCGTIYKASNFEYRGWNPGAKVINWNGKIYHDRAMRVKYKGKLKPFAERLAKAVESGEAFFQETAGKHTFVYNLRKR